MGDVVDFPGKEQLANMHSSRQVAKNVAKGKKITQQQALGALLEMRQIVDGTVNAVGRLSQSMVGYEQILQRIDVNMGTLMTMLKDLGVYEEEDWKAAWKKCVLDPQEKAIAARIEKMKKESAEDAFFAEVLEMVRAYEFAGREINGQQVSGDQLRDFYTQMLLNNQARRQVLDDLRKDMPETPELDLEALARKDEQEATEDTKHPDCHYCGKDDCEFCNPKETQSMGCLCDTPECESCKEAEETVEK